MPEFTRELDPTQGFNFKKDYQKTIGFLTMLKIGTESFAADFTVNSPMAVTTASGITTQATATAGALNVVAVLKSISWAMGDTDPLVFKGLLSIAGKQAFSALLYASMIDIDVEVGFVIYEYDPLAKKYYAAFSNSAQGSTDATATGVKGQIRKEDVNLKMVIQPEADAAVQSPINYEFDLEVVPKPVVQSLLFATSSTRKVTKSWGRTGPLT